MTAPALAAVLRPVDGEEDAVRAERRGRRGAASPSGRRRRGPRSWRPRRPRGPRGSPPTITGRPRSSGRSRCSTAAKNASRSTWRIVGPVRTRLSSRRRDPRPIAPPRPSPVAGRSPARDRPSRLADARRHRRRGRRLRAWPGSRRRRRDRVAWPFLFVDPRLAPGRRASCPGSGPAGRLGVGIVAVRRTSPPTSRTSSASPRAASTGRSRSSTAAILAGASLVLARAPIRGLAPPPSLDPRRRPRGRSRANGRRSCSPPSRSSLVGGVLAANAWHEIPAGWVSGGWNWSDFLVHVSIGQSIVEGNFPPQVPYFAGRPADLPLVRRLPRRDRRRGRRPPRDPGLHRLERAHGRGPGARRVGARPAPDRQPAGGHDRDAAHPRRRRDGLDPPRPRPAGRASGPRWELVQRFPYDNTWEPGGP